MLVTDYRLPGMTGAELVREIRQTRGVRAVVISAYTDEHTIAAARKAGADFFPSPSTSRRCPSCSRPSSGQRGRLADEDRLLRGSALESSGWSSRRGR